MRTALCAAILLAACAAPEKAPPPSPAPPPVQEDPVLDDGQWRAEAKRVVVARHLALAKEYRDASELEKALEHADQAQMLDPSSEEARRLKLELQRMTGQRSGEVTTMLEDEWLAKQAREEQRVLEAQRVLAEAREAEAAGDFERARTLYKRAAFLAREG
jgi:tetratricopeptide (TPR) repeat protein